MELGERKRRILQSIIEAYIDSAEPIGSRTVSRRADMQLSSATIRNEMADLEEMGYLVSPHTSAGRIPSDLGYRFYVNELMRRYHMSAQELNQLRQFFALGALQLDRLIRLAGDMVSQMTNYATVAVTPELKKSCVKRIELVHLDGHSALLILVTSDGMVKNQMLPLSESEETLRRISAVLNERLTGLTLEQINLVRICEINHLLGEYSGVLTPVLDFIHEAITELDGAEVYLSNSRNILHYPEYYDVAKARELLAFLEDKSRVKSAVDQGESDAAVSVIIGRENRFEQMRETSMVTAKYLRNGSVVGKIGIVGPTRMNYPKVVAALEHVTSGINELIRQLYLTEEGSE